MVVSIGRKDEADLNGRRQKEGEREEAKYGRYEIGLVEQESIRVVPVALGTRDRHDAKDDSLERQPSFREHVRQNILEDGLYLPSLELRRQFQRDTSELNRASLSLYTPARIYTCVTPKKPGQSCTTPVTVPRASFPAPHFLLANTLTLFQHSWTISFILPARTSPTRSLERRY